MAQPKYLYPETAENCACRFDTFWGVNNGTGGGPQFTWVFSRVGGICGNCLRLMQEKEKAQA